MNTRSCEASTTTNWDLAGVNGINFGQLQRAVADAETWTQTEMAFMSTCSMATLIDQPRRWHSRVAGLQSRFEPKVSGQTAQFPVAHTPF